MQIWSKARTMGLNKSMVAINASSPETNGIWFQKPSIKDWFHKQNLADFLSWGDRAKLAETVAIEKNKGSYIFVESLHG